VRAHHLDALYVQLAASGLGAPRIHRVHAILRVAFTQAVRWQWIARNPAVDARPPSTRRAPIRVPSPDEMRRLIDAADEEFAITSVSFDKPPARAIVCAALGECVDSSQ